MRELPRAVPLFSRPISDPSFWKRAKEWDELRLMAVRNQMKAQAIRHEAELKALLGMWVSELTPTLVVSHTGHWLGLAAEECCHIGEKPTIVLPISLVRDAASK